MQWLESIPRAEQLTSAVAIGELYTGAYRSANSEFHVERIESKVLPAITVLVYDESAARTYGEIEAQLYRRGVPLADPDLQIAATALHHGLDLVTGNVRHFERVPGLTIARVLIDWKRP